MLIAMTTFFGVAFAVFLGMTLHRNGFIHLAAMCYAMAAIFSIYMVTLY